MFQFNKFRLSAGLAAALLLGACGGGSGGGTAGNTTVKANTLTEAALSKSTLTPSSSEIAASLNALNFGAGSGGTLTSLASKSTDTRLKALLKKPALRQGPVAEVIAQAATALGFTRVNGKLGYINLAHKSRINFATTTDLSAGTCTTGTANLTNNGSANDLSNFDASITFDECETSEADGNITLDGTIALKGTSNVEIDQATGDIKNPNDIQATLTVTFTDFKSTGELDGNLGTDTETINGSWGFEEKQLIADGKMSAEAAMEMADFSILSDLTTTVLIGNLAAGFVFNSPVDTNNSPTCESDSVAIGVLENSGTSYVDENHDGTIADSENLGVVSVAVLLTDEDYFATGCSAQTDSIVTYCAFQVVDSEIQAGQYICYNVSDDSSIAVLGADGNPLTVAFSENSTGGCEVTLEGSASATSTYACPDTDILSKRR